MRKLHGMEMQVRRYISVTLVDSVWSRRSHDIACQLRTLCQCTNNLWSLLGEQRNIMRHSLYSMAAFLYGFACPVKVEQTEVS